MHSWGDKDFHYWEEINQAAEMIAKFCLTWGRISVRDWKEKWGTVRVYCGFGYSSLGGVISPRTMWYGNWPKWSQWVWWVYIPNWINRLIIPYQAWIYRIAYKRAIQKYPMIREEILCCADWDEYLKGL